MEKNRYDKPETEEIIFKYEKNIFTTGGGSGEGGSGDGGSGDDFGGGDG